MNKKTLLIVSLLITLFLIGNVLAITAKIGNGVMVLRGETGDEIERYVLVINDNNISVDIKLTASGDLKDYITIKDTEFTLKPGEEKKAYFTIEVRKEGKTESKINVQFTPVDGKNGVGLSSTITVIANGENLDEDDDTNIDEDTDFGNDADSPTRSASASITADIVVGKLNKNMIAFGTTMILALIFIVVLILYYVKFKKKPEENENIAIKEEITSKEENTATKKTKLKKRVKKRA